MIADFVTAIETVIWGAVIAVCVVVGISALLTIALGAWMWRALRRPRPADEQQAAVAPARRDIEPGINLALQDECELIWSIPAPTTPDPSGLDRLRAAIRDEQKGEQQ